MARFAGSSVEEAVLAGRAGLAAPLLQGPWMAPTGSLRKSPGLLNPHRPVSTHYRMEAA